MIAGEDRQDVALVVAVRDARDRVRADQLDGVHPIVRQPAQEPVRPLPLRLATPCEYYINLKHEKLIALH